MKYKRVLLKVSGEALSGKTPIDFEKATETALQIKALHDAGCLLGVVVGGGNIWRGRSGGTMDRSRADNIGMLATAMNALALEQHSSTLTFPFECFPLFQWICLWTVIPHAKRTSPLTPARLLSLPAVRGAPFFSTDTASALRAAQIHADALLLAKNVDGIYTADPNVCAEAKRYARISYDEVITKNLKATDLTAMSFCREYSIPMVLFKMHSAEALVAAVNGENAGTIVDAQPGFELV